MSLAFSARAASEFLFNPKLPLYFLTYQWKKDCSSSWLLSTCLQTWRAWHYHEFVWMKVLVHTRTLRVHHNVFKNPALFKFHAICYFSLGGFKTCPHLHLLLSCEAFQVFLKLYSTLDFVVMCHLYLFFKSYDVLVPLKFCILRSKFTWLDHDNIFSSCTFVKR